MKRGIKKIREASELLRESLQNLEEAKYFIEILEKELEEYKQLVDKDSFLPKAKFVKQRISRLIERIKYLPDEFVLAGIAIKIPIIENKSFSEEHSIMNYLLAYIDGHIRPNDLLFKIDNKTVGIIFILKDKSSLDVIAKRLDSILLNLKAQTYSNRNILINYQIKSFIVGDNDSSDDVLDKMKNFK